MSTDQRTLSTKEIIYRSSLSQATLLWTGTEAGPRKISARLLEVNGKRYEVGVTIGTD